MGRTLRGKMNKPIVEDIAMDEVIDRLKELLPTSTRIVVMFEKDFTIQNRTVTIEAFTSNGMETFAATTLLEVMGTVEKRAAGKS
jgi:hypothetical protein